MAKDKIRPFQPVELLTSDAAIAVFVADALETEDSGYITHALGVAAEAKATIQRGKLGDLMAEMPDGLPRVEGWDELAAVGQEKD